MYKMICNCHDLYNRNNNPENQEGIPALPGAGYITILVDKDGRFVPSGDYFHPSQMLPTPNTYHAEFETLKQQYLSSLEYIKELEAKNKELTARLAVLENSVGTGMNH